MDSRDAIQLLSELGNLFTGSFNFMKAADVEKIGKDRAITFLKALADKLQISIKRRV